MTDLNTRRHVLGDAIAGLAGAVLLAGAGAATATPEVLGGMTRVDGPLDEPDVDLIQLCSQFDRLEVASYRIIDSEEERTFAQEREAEARAEPLRRQQSEIAERIIATTASTPAGLRAKARSLTLWGINTLDDEAELIEGRLLASLLSDLCGVEIRSTKQAFKVLSAQVDAERST